MWGGGGGTFVLEYKEDKIENWSNFERLENRANFFHCHATQDHKKIVHK
jgi:hypothetical protein